MVFKAKVSWRWADRWKAQPDVLLIVRAGTPDEIVQRLRDDPWTGRDLLRISQISEWTLRLGALK
jgi:hypothetical protein